MVCAFAAALIKSSFTSLECYLNRSGVGWKQVWAAEQKAEDEMHANANRTCIRVMS